VRVGHRRGAEEGADAALVRAQPGIKLVNAYGLTETSDDTNHEIMDSVPDRERVPLGPPINNVHVYVVDEHLSPAPLGAPGELVSPECVSGAATSTIRAHPRAFLADPHRESQRLYRSGTMGAGCPRASWSFSAAGILRSRSVASG